MRLFHIWLFVIGGIGICLSMILAIAAIFYLVVDDNSPLPNNLWIRILAGVFLFSILSTTFVYLILLLI